MNDKVIDLRFLNDFEEVKNYYPVQDWDNIFKGNISKDIKNKLVGVSFK